MDGVVLFYTIHELFRREKALLEEGLAVKAIPTPRVLSSDCGTALRFDWAAVDRVRRTVEEVGVEVQGIHELEP